MSLAGHRPDAEDPPAGRLDGYRAQIFADVLGTASDELVAVVVPKILPARRACRRGSCGSG